MPRRPPARGPASIIDVARLAQVSIGTASRVINGHPAVLPANVTAVHNAMTTLGYHPPAPENRRGRRRRTTSTRVALLLLGEYDLTWMTDRSPVYSHVVHGIQRAMAEWGGDLVVRHLPTYGEAEALLRQQPPTGVILFGAEPADQPPTTLTALPSVWVMGSPKRFAGDHLLPDHRRIGLLAAEHLVHAGHRICGFLGWDLSGSDARTNDGALRGLVFGAALAAAGGRMIAVQQDGLYDHAHNRTDDRVLDARLDHLFTLKEPPTALFLGMDAYAPSVYRSLQRRGLRPGRDVAIVTCNNERPFLNGLDPAPVVIDINAGHLGMRAVERLRWRIAHPQAPAEQMLIAPQLLRP